MNTFTVDRKTFEEFPDRSTLTGMPMPNQVYRDSREPDHVFKWELAPVREGETRGEWQTFLRVEP